MSTDPYASHLQKAEALLAQGEVVKAGQVWQAILKREPGHPAALRGLLEVRSRLRALPPGPADPAPDPAPDAGAGLEGWLAEGCVLYDLGQLEEALGKWDQVLAVAPDHALARAYAEGVRRELAEAPGAPLVPAPPTPEPLVEVGLAPAARIALVEDPGTAPSAPAEVRLPAALVQPAPPQREGFPVATRLQAAADRVPWIRNRRTLAWVLGGTALALGVLVLLNGYRRDLALRAEVRAAKALALAPAAGDVPAADLGETADAIAQEAESVQSIDPVRAFLRAETLTLRDPADAAAVQRLERMRKGLAGGGGEATLEAYLRHLQQGNLEAAGRVMDSLLRAQPGDADLRARAVRLHLALCSAHAAQARWDEAREDLLRGRALLPGDRTWQARLRLLDHLRTLPKAQQAAWTPLLG